MLQKKLTHEKMIFDDIKDIITLGCFIAAKKKLRKMLAKKLTRVIKSNAKNKGIVVICLLYSNGLIKRNQTVLSIKS